jgi:hypothetical protein
VQGVRATACSELVGNSDLGRGREGVPEEQMMVELGCCGQCVATVDHCIGRWITVNGGDSAPRIEVRIEGFNGFIINDHRGVIADDHRGGRGAEDK